MNLNKFAIEETEEHLIIPKYIGRIIKINSKYYNQNKTFFVLKNTEKIKNNINEKLNKVTQEDLKVSINTYLNDLKLKNNIKDKEFKLLFIIINNFKLLEISNKIKNNIFEFKLDKFSALNIINDYNIKLPESIENFTKTKFFINLNVKDKKDIIDQLYNLNDLQKENIIDQLYI